MYVEAVEPRVERRGKEFSTVGNTVFEFPDQIIHLDYNARLYRLRNCLNSNGRIERWIGMIRESTIEVQF